MTKRLLAAIAAALTLAACGANYGTPTPGAEASIGDEMASPDLMLPDGEIDDATGTEIP